MTYARETSKKVEKSKGNVSVSKRTVWNNTLMYRKDYKGLYAKNRGGGGRHDKERERVNGDQD